jgi:hypothetical protein
MRLDEDFREAALPEEGTKLCSFLYCNEMVPSSSLGLLLALRALKSPLVIDLVTIDRTYKLQP